MVKKSIRQAIFFVLLFLMFFLFVKLGEFWRNKTAINSDISIMIVGVIYVLIVVSLFYLAKLDNCHEGFWDVDPAAVCGNSPWFWQGDSEEAKTCRKLASTPEGRVAISDYNCPIGYVGRPMSPFYYSPLSDDNWQNERCMDIPSCKPVDVGLCSFEKQIP